MDAAHELTRELAPKSLGKAIARAREDAGLEQEELAEMVGVHGKTISRWERSVNTAVPFESVVRIAEATGHSLDFFAVHMEFRTSTTWKDRGPRHLASVPCPDVQLSLFDDMGHSPYPPAAAAAPPILLAAVA
jgi:DNA-binding XRE family transcriptional regulator